MTKKMPTLAHLLTPFPHTIDSHASLTEAERQMHDQQVRHLVVMTDNDFSGLLSERDIQQHHAYSTKKEDLTVDDVCTHTVVVADIHDPLDRVLDAMAQHLLGSVVVLKEGELIGILTTTDVCKYFSQFLKESFPASPPDNIA